MSGFAAIVSYDGFEVDPPAIQRIAQRINYRGPDVSGTYTDPNATLIQSLNLFRVLPRLPNVPLILENCIIAADVRLDARIALIDRLRSAGRNVESNALDELLVLHAYHVYGERCVEHLSGDFSFTIWDSRTRQLFAARDQIGRHNLYFSTTTHGVIVSNELGAIKHYPGVNTELDPLYVADFLMLGEGFWIDKSSTPFKAIRRLERGHILVVQGKDLSTHQYWSLPSDQPLLRYRKEADFVEHFRSIFREAVQDRLAADKVVITLSGGMDSSTVSATAIDLIRSQKVFTQATSLTSVYTGIADPEEGYGRANAEFLGISEMHILYKIPRYSLIHPYIHVSNAIRQNVTTSNWLDFQRFLAAHGKIVLYGYLGDLLVSDLPLAQYFSKMDPFAFVSAYRRLANHFGKRPALRTNLVARLKGIKPTSMVAYSLPPWLDPAFIRKYNLQERWDDYWQWVGTLGQASRNPYLFRLLENYDYYTHDESDAINFTPAVSVDPFSDLRMINFLAKLPPLPWFYQKYILRKAMAGKLPPEVLRRPKQILGDLTAHLLSLPENTWIDQWQPTQELESFVVREQIPKITGKHARIGGSQGVHLRPIVLDMWLNAERGNAVSSDLPD